MNLIDSFGERSPCGFIRARYSAAVRAIDIAHMKGPGVLLDSYAYMSDPANAQPVLDSLTGAPPHMPPAARMVAIANRAVRKMDERRLQP